MTSNSTEYITRKCIVGTKHGFLVSNSLHNIKIKIINFIQQYTILYFIKKLYMTCLVGHHINHLLS